MGKVHIKDFLVRNDKPILISLPAMVNKLLAIEEGDTLQLHVDIIHQELIVTKKEAE